MKNFFNSFKRSMSDHTLYEEVTTGTRPLKMLYIFGLAVITTLVTVTLVTVTLYTTLIPELRTAITENIPSDLVATIKSGELSVNKPMPYVIPLKPEDVKEGYENGLVVNTEVPAKLESLKEYKTRVFVNKTTILGEKSNGQIQAIPLKDLPDFTLTQESALGLLDKVTNFAWIVPIIAFIPVLAVEFISILITVFISAFFLWLILKTLSRSLPFGLVFNATMYGYTLVFVVVTILSPLLALAAIQMPGVFIQSAVTAIITYIFMMQRPWVEEIKQ